METPCQLYECDPLPFNSLPHNKFLDWTTLKAFADKKLSLAEKLKFILGKHCGKRRKRWKLSPTMFSKGPIPRVG